MSQKSTARTGSEGDAEYNKETRNTNRRSGTSSCKSRRDIFGGPFGDSLFDQLQDAYEDYLLVMIGNDEDAAGTSEGSQDDPDPCNLRTNYTHQLNLVRRNLGLLDISEENQRCTITEIVEDSAEDLNQESSRGVFETFRQTTNPKGYEVTTIHPFSLNYNRHSGSSTNAVEPDYSPPVKKVCQRLKTPRFASVSEGNVPYYTKVSIHDSTFVADSKSGTKKESKNSVRNMFNQFTETRETQCNEEEFKNINIDQRRRRECTISNSPPPNEDDLFINLSFESETETESEDEKPTDGVLFPKVIIENKRQLDGKENSWSSTSTTVIRANPKKDSGRKLSDVVSLNSVRGSSDDDSYTVVKTDTIVNASGKKKKSRRKKGSSKNTTGSSKSVTIWEEIKKPRSGSLTARGGGDVAPEVGYRVDAEKVGSIYSYKDVSTYVNHLSQKIQWEEIIKGKNATASDEKLKLNQYIQEYVQYKKGVEKARATSASKCTVVAHKLTKIDNKILDSPEKLESGASLGSDEDKFDDPLSSARCGENSGARRFWERLCLCLCPSRNSD